MEYLLIAFRGINILRGLLYPVLRPIYFFIPALNRRIIFENRNLKDPACKSFKEDKKKAKVAFEVSSEGELEQVLPVINRLLKEGSLVELVYASESVELKVQALYDKHPKLLRILRMPLLSYFPRGLIGGQSLRTWLTSTTLVLCRYDFYPELILHGRMKGNRLILLSATLKSKRPRLVWLIWREWYGLFYNVFDEVVCATVADLHLLKHIGVRHEKLSVYDFRVIQIFDRLKSAQTKLETKSFWPKLNDWLESFDKQNRLIIGSAWPTEMALFSNARLRNKITKGELAVVLAPHKLDQGSLNSLEKEFHKQGSSLGFYIIDRSASEEDVSKTIELWKEHKGVVVVTAPGVLVEMYTLFGHAFVAGGHGRSIHSVLEPFLGGSYVYCGPKTHRSTEFDLIGEMEPTSIKVIDQLNTLSDELIDDQTATKEQRLALGREIESQFIPMFNKVIQGIKNC